MKKDRGIGDRKASRPTPLGDALEQFLSNTDVGGRIEEAAVVPEWGERVGPAIAAVTVPLRVNRGTLLVGVRSSAWLMELKLMEAEIVRRLNRDRGRGKISKIRFQMLEG
jgi:predicted nucleic acid-binding Zn ribbon protein